MWLAYCKIAYEHREISLNQRPKSLYEISSKGTVPVLITSDGTIIDESIDIMIWCIKRSNMHTLLNANDSSQEIFDLIERNDKILTKLTHM